MYLVIIGAGVIKGPGEIYGSRVVARARKKLLWCAELLRIDIEQPVIIFKPAAHNHHAGSGFHVVAYL